LSVFTLGEYTTEPVFGSNYIPNACVTFILGAQSITCTSTATDRLKIKTWDFKALCEHLYSIKVYLSGNRSTGYWLHYLALYIYCISLICNIYYILCDSEANSGYIYFLLSLLFICLFIRSLITWHMENSKILFMW
jgi:hypothetical protein